MSRISEADYIAMQARLKSREPVTCDSCAASREDKLHDQIMEHCRSRRWVVIHSRMDRPTTQGLGVPDFIILIEDGKLLLVEAKARQGKLSIEQIAFGIRAEQLGHKVHVVRSLANFIDLTSQIPC